MRISTFKTATARNDRGDFVTVMQFGDEIVCHNYGPIALGKPARAKDFDQLIASAIEEMERGQ